MEGNKMDTRPNPLFLQAFDKFASGDRELFEIQADHVQMPGVLRPVVRIFRSISMPWWQENLADIRQPLIVHPGDLVPSHIEVIAFLELVDSDRGGNIRHIVFESGFVNLVVPTPFGRITLPGVLTDSMEPHDSHGLGVLVIVRRCHAAFAGRDVFVRVEAEGRDVSDRAHHFSLVSCRKSVGRILDHLDAIFLCYREDRVHLTGQTTNVNRNNGSESFVSPGVL